MRSGRESQFDICLYAFSEIRFLHWDDRTSPKRKEDTIHVYAFRVQSRSVHPKCLCASLRNLLTGVEGLENSQNIQSSCASLIEAPSACHASTIKPSDLYQVAVRKSCWTCSRPPWPGAKLELNFWVSRWNLSVRLWELSPSSNSIRSLCVGPRDCVAHAHILNNKQVNAGESDLLLIRSSHHWL